MAKNYSDLTQEEVDALIKEKVPRGADVYEIGCGGKSAVTFGEMYSQGYINSYFGTNITKEGVLEAKEKGLDTKVVSRDYDYMPMFKALRNYGKNGVVVMFGLSEVAPDAARKYKKQAESEGLTVAMYPKIN